jgi:5-methylcytosine-specific restriction endonuclease McrA
MKCECGCGEQPNPGKRFIKGHQVVLMQGRNKTRVYSREHLEKLWAGNRGKKKGCKYESLQREIDCACGCGGKLLTPDLRGRERRYLPDHMAFVRAADIQKERHAKERQSNPLKYGVGPKFPAKNKHWDAARTKVFERDNSQCVICYTPVAYRNAHCHHILARKHGGDETLENLVTLCQSCHAKQHQLYGTPEYKWSSHIAQVQ